jgi:hypothetical protein
MTRFFIGLLLALCVLLVLAPPAALAQGTQGRPNYELNSTRVTLSYGRMQELTEASKMICYRVAIEPSAKTKARLEYETRYMSASETVFVTLLCTLYLEGLQDMNRAQAEGTSQPITRS